MKPRHWADSPWIGFDTETTSADPQSARILHIDPGEEIPAEASAIHGFTWEALRDLNAMEPKSGIPAITVYVHGRSTMRSYPLVIFNARYDWPLLLAEITRTGGVPPGFLETTPYILDPFVIDRALDKYRKGSRKLEDVARHYKVPLNGAHDAVADAKAAIGVTRALIKAYPQLRDFDLESLQAQQAQWFEDWKRGINRHWESKGKTDRVTGSWPGLEKEVAA